MENVVDRRSMLSTENRTKQNVFLFFFFSLSYFKYFDYLSPTTALDHQLKNRRVLELRDLSTECANRPIESKRFRCFKRDRRTFVLLCECSVEVEEVFRRPKKEKFHREVRSHDTNIRNQNLRSSLDRSKNETNRFSFSFFDRVFHLRNQMISDDAEHQTTSESI